MAREVSAERLSAERVWSGIAAVAVAVDAERAFAERRWPEDDWFAEAVSVWVRVPVSFPLISSFAPESGCASTAGYIERRDRAPAPRWIQTPRTPIIHHVIGARHRD